ncbi:PAS domain S-box-containing protein/diguanylate cyclase (GGDEF)-like protein [Plasticicumulans lactativorans]|uniref:PAS domain S-box-containing protein/diguanylate cyclase (GGDEF)-like protein n=1 Tax=Plasticicumulans lactativorans TaxID=1133106 RepID=A0A4R2L1Q0_9GAMM|nr:GGDEF and EAL domain-containing protein [Plasticicumulans lactativorans]TCO80961.1 PAS domain S-box-containing protein/diguanylate cyclase (GGDEF)-like protein [Plasticicumulans lactativorans]
MSRRSLLAYVPLLAAVLVLVLGLFTVLLGLRSQQIEQRRDFRDDLIYFAAQFSREANVFERLFAAAARGERIDPEAMSVAFDVLWSRVGGAFQGALGKVYRELPDGEATALAGRALLAEIEPVLASVGPGDPALAPLQARLLLLIERLNNLVREASRFQQAQVEARRDTFESSYARALLMLGAAVLAGALLVLLLLRRQRALDALRRELEAHVAERTAALARVNADLREEINWRRRAHEAIRKLSLALEQSPAAVVITDPDGVIEYVNARYAQASGQSALAAVGTRLVLAHAGGVDPLARARAGGSWQGEVQLDSAGGGERWQNLSVAPVRADDGRITHLLVIQEDITRRKHDESQLLWRAHYDELTGLPNRVLALDRLGQAMRSIERGARGALLFLDLDNFKAINDRLGHDVGDRVLREVAGRLGGAVRAEDTVARFGGDEFLVVLPRIDDALEVERIIERMSKAVAEPLRLGEHELFTGFSLGAALFPDDGREPYALLKAADTAMYAVKAEGRAGFRFYTGRLNQLAHERARIESALRVALVRNEFMLVYQPVFDAGGKALVGAEALLRWRNPEFAEVPVDRWIRIAEESGAIVEIGDWVLRRACEEAAAWVDAQPSLRISVNLSARQLRENHFPGRVLEILAGSRLPPANLVLEITERLLLADDGGTREAIATLEGAGVRFAIDDFGTGYSSLAMLKRLPSGMLKLDRSFIADLERDASSGALVEGAITMARALGMKVVAEGVETEAQRAFLATHGCDFLQGWLFSRAVAAADFAARFIGRPPRPARALVVVPIADAVRR